MSVIELSRASTAQAGEVGGKAAGRAADACPREMMAFALAVVRERNQARVAEAVDRLGGQYSGEQALAAVDAQLDLLFTR